MNDATRCLEKYTTLCSSQRMTIILSRNHEIPPRSQDPNKPDHAESKYKAKPYKSLAKRNGSQLRTLLLNKMQVADPLAMLVFGLDNMSTVLIEVVTNCVQVYIDAQLQWLKKQLTDCESSSMNNISTRSGSSDMSDNDIHVQTLQSTWRTVFQGINEAFTVFKKTALHDLKVHVKDKLIPKLNKRIHEELLSMRLRALAVKKKSRKFKTLNAARLNKFKERVDVSAALILDTASKSLEKAIRKHPLQGFVTAAKNALTDQSKWLTEIDYSRSTILDTRYTMLCKQLRQLIAIDSAEARATFKYATVANIPLLSDKLRAVYCGDDNQEFLTSVLNDDVGSSNGGSSDNTKHKRKHTDVCADVASDYSDNSGDSYDSQYS
jgi:hypothetical protein